MYTKKGLGDGYNVRTTDRGELQFTAGSLIPNPYSPVDSMHPIDPSILVPNYAWGGGSIEKCKLVPPFVCPDDYHKPSASQAISNPIGYTTPTYQYIGDTGTSQSSYVATYPMATNAIMSAIQNATNSISTYLPSFLLNPDGSINWLYLGIGVGGVWYFFIHKKGRR